MTHLRRNPTTLLTAAGATLALAGAAVLSAPAPAEAQDGISGLPDTITLTGVVRDFRERRESNGHPDFERRPDAGFGHYMGNVAMELDEDHKPVFTGEGRKVSRQWSDAQGRPLHPSLYDGSLGDSAGNWGSYDAGGIQSANSFAQWFRDAPGVNMSKSLDLTLVREQGSNVYTFDDRQDPDYSRKGGFFPINGQLLGNSDGDNKNFHFTFELQTQFTYRADSGQVFTFNGDDDVWVFIDDRLVIDIGGVHSRVAQTVDLDRLDWLEDGRKYRLSFFFAERHRTQSNFRIETTIELQNAALPTVFGMAD